MHNNKARRKYNGSVRQLAQFVKERDKRVLQRKKEAEEKKAAQGRRRREKLEKEKLVSNEEQQLERMDGEEMGDYSHDDVKINKGLESGEPSGTSGALYCSICCKKFKSDMQWKNHQRSKKHRDREGYNRVL